MLQLNVWKSDRSINSKKFGTSFLHTLKINFNFIWTSWISIENYHAYVSAKLFFFILMLSSLVQIYSMDGLDKMRNVIIPLVLLQIVLITDSRSKRLRKMSFPPPKKKKTEEKRQESQKQEVLTGVLQDSSTRHLEDRIFVPELQINLATCQLF